MQWGGLKILCLITGLMIYSGNSIAQTSGFRLKTADSLYVAKRYTQSFELYQSILKQGEYTPAMLLKMAFIQEGLNHIGQAMYYLNLYFIASRDQSALDKMEELATKYNLEGYKTSDADRFLSFYHDYHRWISAGLAAIAIFLLSLMFFISFRRKERPIASLIVLTLFLIGFAIHLYVGDKVSSGIITSPKTYVMTGPSSAASVIQVVSDGNRVEVIGKKDVWLKVKWFDQTGYIKQNNLQMVEL
jgi:hypothetical protein